MFWYIATAFTTLAIIIGKTFDLHTIIINRVSDIRQINSAVSVFDTQKGSPKKTIASAITTFKMIGQLLWFNILHRINNSIQDHGNGLVSYTYILDGRLYKFPVKKRKGPNLIFLILDENGEDVSSLILPYFGPERDWHGKEFTPSFWGRKGLTFELSSGDSLSFSENEAISL